jgi:hypothetical protein
LFVLLGLTIALSAWLTISNQRPRLPAEPERRVQPHPERAAAAQPSPSRRVTRNLFQYGDATAPPPGPAAPRTPRPAPAVATPTPETHVTLVGIVRREDGPHAALSIDGNVVVLAAGQSAEGYTVVEVSDETGVRVRTPEGSELVITPLR